MAIFSKYVGMFGTLINSIVGTGNISVSTSAGVSTIDGSALATTTLNNLGTTAVNKNLNMAGTTTNADLLWNTAAGGSIGVGYSQTSGTDHRPKKMFLTDALIVGSSSGLPPYGQNNALVTGSIAASNLTVSPTFCQTVMSGNSFWNSINLGTFAFVKDGAATAGAPGFINMGSETDRDIYFSLLYRTAARSDLLKFAADGSLSLLKSSGANLLWGTDGAGDIGSPDAGTTFKRPANIFLSNYGQIGTAVNLQGPSAASGFIEVGNTTNGSNDTFTFMGAGGGFPVTGVSSAQMGFTSQIGGGLFAYLEWMWPGQTQYVADGDVAWNSPLSGASMILRAAGTVDFVNGSTTGVTINGGGTVDTSVSKVRTQLRVSYSSPATVAVGALANKLEVFDAAGTSLGFVPIYASIT